MGMDRVEVLSEISKLESICKSHKLNLTQFISDKNIYGKSIKYEINRYKKHIKSYQSMINEIDAVANAQHDNLDDNDNRELRYMRVMNRLRIKQTNIKLKRLRLVAQYITMFGGR